MVDAELPETPNPATPDPIAHPSDGTRTRGTLTTSPTAAHGIEPPAHLLYRLLLNRPDTTAPQLATEANLPLADVQHHLTQLSHGGLITPVTDSQYRAHAPDASLGEHIGLQLDNLRSNYSLLQDLLEIYREGGHDGHHQGTRWESITGQAAIQARLMRMEAGAELQIRNFVKSPIVMQAPNYDEHEVRQQRGVHQQILYERGILNDLDDEVHMDYLHRCIEYGDEVRFAAQLPVKLVLVDGRELLLEEPPTDQPRALITSHPPIVALADSLFEQLWMTSVPAPHSEEETSHNHGPSEEDRLLLSLLIAGLTDQAIATRLGIGLRTVQRRVRELMNLAQVDTRIQLGWQAARRHWVVPDPAE